jgi:hypothetical protein
MIMKRSSSIVLGKEKEREPKVKFKKIARFNSQI